MNPDIEKQADALKEACKAEKHPVLIVVCKEGQAIVQDGGDLRQIGLALTKAAEMDYNLAAMICACAETILEAATKKPAQA